MSDSGHTGATVHDIGYVADEVCELEFERFAERFGVDVDKAHMDDEDRQSFDNSKRVLMIAMSKKHLVIDENGLPIYTPHAPDTRDKSPITFYAPKGASLMASDNKKDGHDVGKTFAVMAAVTHTSAKLFSEMEHQDLKVCSALLAIFLG